MAAALIFSSLYVRCALDTPVTTVTLPDTIRGLPVARPTDLGSLLAPHLRVADPANPLVGLEASALAIAVTVLRASGRVLREELTRERSRFRELEHLVYRLPAADREGE